MIGSAALAGLAALATSVWARPEPRLIYNPSPSAPRGWYLVSPFDRPPRRGDLVLALAPDWARRLADQRRYVPANVPLLKPVIAVRGAIVCRAGQRVRIDGRAIAIARPSDAMGRAMPVWQGCRTLGPREVFLLAAPPGSFDGRYFGPIPTSRIIARARPLWTW